MRWLIGLATPVLSLAVTLGGCGDRDDRGDLIGGPNAIVAPEPTRTDRSGEDEPDTSATEPSVRQTAAAESLPEGYVGTKACAECHTERHASYLLTHHSRSLRHPEPDDMPSGLAFHHPPSHRSYFVEPSADGWHHREERYFGDSPETDQRMPIARLPVEYVMGSGAFAKAYLVRDGDYVLQSPVTWYTAREAYEIAPGYDTSSQRGFARIVEDNCVYCHAGLVSVPDGNPNVWTLHELAIGCERCHGPGAEHAELYRGGTPASDISESKIVNPSRLDRGRAEAICAQCHLDSDVTVFAAGEQVWDFEPGESLSANRVAYKGQRSDGSAKTFSNHFDQMWQSSCYRQSESLTCTSCHDPHASDPPTDRVAAYRETCLKCHDDHGCSLPLPQREQTNQNACTACHMPRAPSDVPHASITNHLIAVYDDDGQPVGVPSEPVEKMRRVTRSTAPLSDAELLRRDTLAAANWAIIQALEGNDEPVLSYDAADLKQLADDGDLDAASAMAEIGRRTAEALLRQPEPEDAAGRAAQIKQLRELSHHYAVKVLRQESSPTKRRQMALETLADKLMIDQSFDQATPLYEQLTRIRRDSRDWYNLALCYAPQQRIADAEAALQTSLQIDAAYPKPYASLAKIYGYIDRQTAARYDAIYRALTEGAE